MPHHKSAKKRVKTNEQRRQANVARRSRMRHALRDTRQMLGAASGALDDAQRATVTGTVSLLDKMVKKGLIHRNQAARLKSRLQRRANAAGN